MCMMSSRNRRKIFRNIGLSASLFISQPVFAEPPITCICKRPSKIEYISDGQSREVSISEFTSRFGKVIAMYCGVKHTFLVLENAMVRTGGGAKVFETGSTDVCIKKEGKRICKIADVEMLSGKAVYAEVEWGKVAVVVFNDKSMTIFKRLDSENNFISVNTEPFEKIDLRNISIKIRGDPAITTIEVFSRYKQIIELEITGTTYGNIKINEKKI